MLAKPKGRGRARPRKHHHNDRLQPGFQNGSSEYSSIDESSSDSEVRKLLALPSGGAVTGRVKASSSVEAANSISEQFVDAEEARENPVDVSVPLPIMTEGVSESGDITLVKEPANICGTPPMVKGGPSGSVVASPASSVQSTGAVPDSGQGGANVSSLCNSAASTPIDLCSSSDGNHTYKIRVTHVVDPSNFYAQFGRGDSFEHFAQLETALGEFCQKNDTEKSQEFDIRFPVLARQMLSQKWKRAEVMNIDRDCDEIEVYFVDYGLTEILQTEDIIYPVPNIFFQFPGFAHFCGLDGIQPLAGSWISRARDYFSKLVLDEELQADVTLQQGVMKVVIFISVNEEEKSVADLLLEEELAIPCPSPSAPSTEHAGPMTESTPTEEVEEIKRESPPAEEVQLEDTVNKLKEDATPMTKSESSSAESEENVVVAKPTKVPPAFQFSQLFKPSAEMKKPVSPVPASPETPAEPVWETDNLIDMFGKEVVEARRMEKSLKHENHDVRAGERIPDIEHQIRKLREKGFNDGASPTNKQQKLKKKSWNRNISPQRDVKLSKTSGQCSPRVPSPAHGIISGIKHIPGVAPPESHVSEQRLKDEAVTKILHFISEAAATRDSGHMTSLLNDIKKYIAEYDVDIGVVYDSVKLEMHMRTTFRKALVRLEENLKPAVELMSILEKHEAFGLSFGFVMPALMNEFMRVSTNGRSRSKNFCAFLVEFVIASSKWTERSREAVLEFTIKTMEKWVIFNKKKHNISTDELQLTFLQSALHVLTDVGHILDAAHPDKLAQLFNELKEKQLDDQTSRSMRQSLLELIILQAKGWGRPPKHVMRQDSWAQYESPSQCTIGLQCDFLPLAGDGLVGKDQVKGPEMKKSADNIEPEDNKTGLSIADPDDEALNDVSIVKSLAADSAYTKVKQMLYDLHLDDLYSTCVSWGIKDEVIDSEDMDLSSYLCSCGFSMPHVNKIMVYLGREVSETVIEKPQSPSPMRKLQNLPSYTDTPEDFYSFRIVNRSVSTKLPETGAPMRENRVKNVDSSPSSLQELAESLFKTPKEIKTENLSGRRKQYSEVHGTPERSHKIEEDFPALPSVHDDDEENQDEALPLKSLSFSSILKSQAAKDTVEEFLSKEEKVQKMPPSVHRVAQPHLNHTSKHDGEPSAVNEQKRSIELKRLLNWYAGEYKDALLSSVRIDSVSSINVVHGSNYLPPVLRQGWKKNLYSQTLSVSKDTCNNVITCPDSLGLNAISDVLDEHGAGDGINVKDKPIGGTKEHNSPDENFPKMSSSNEKNSGHVDSLSSKSKNDRCGEKLFKGSADSSDWWRADCSDADLSTAKRGNEISSRGEKSKTTQKSDHKSNYTDWRRDPAIKIEKDEKSNLSCPRQPSPGNSKNAWKVDETISGVDSRNSSSGNKVLSSGGLSAENVPTKTSSHCGGKSGRATPDNWSEISDNDDNGNVQVIVQPKETELDKKHRPKINRASLKALVTDWVVGSAEQDGVCSSSEITRSEKSENMAEASPKEVSPNSPQYRLDYVPDLSDDSLSKTLETNAADDDLSERKFAFEPGDTSSSDDDEISITLNRQMEEKRILQKRMEKYVKPPPKTGQTPFALTVKCLKCGDTAHRTHDCPNISGGILGAELPFPNRYEVV